MPRRSCPARVRRRPADPALAAPSSVQHPDRVLIRDLLHAKNDVDQSKQLSVGHWIRLLPRHHAWNHEIIALARRGTTVIPEFPEAGCTLTAQRLLGRSWASLSVEHAVDTSALFSSSVTFRSSSSSSAGVIRHAQGDRRRRGVEGLALLDAGLPLLELLGGLALVAAQFGDQRDHSGVGAGHQPIGSFPL